MMTDQFLGAVTTLTLSHTDCTTLMYSNMSWTAQ
jgi:hypothetical protein